MAFLDDLMMNALGAPDEEEEESPSQIIARSKLTPKAQKDREAMNQSRADLAAFNASGQEGVTLGKAAPPVPGATPSRILGIGSKPAESSMPEPTTLSPGVLKEETIQDDPTVDLTDINNTGAGQLKKILYTEGTTNQQFEPVLPAEEIRQIIRKNQDQLDTLYKRATQSSDELTQQEIERRFGKGWGGFGKRFLTEFMLGMGGSSVTQKMQERYERERKQAESLYGMIKNSQGQLLQSARSMDSTYAGILRDEAKNRIAAFNALSQDKYKTDRVKLTQNLQDAQIDAIRKGMDLTQARADWTKNQISLLQKTGNTSLDTAETFGKAYAENAMANDSGFAQEYQANPNDPSKWSPKLYDAYQKAFKQGILDYMKEKDKMRPAGGGGKVVSQIVATPTTGYFDKDGNFVNTIMVFQKNPNGGVGVQHLSMEGTPLQTGVYGLPQGQKNYDRVNQLTENINTMGQAFDQVAALDDKARDRNFGLIAGHPLLIEMKKANWIPGLEGANNVPALMNVLSANKNWVNYLYTYSGKVVNEREMQAIKGFIPTLQSHANIYETMAAVSYYKNLMDRARYMRSPVSNLKIGAEENTADTLKKAALISLKSSTESRKYSGAHPIRLDSEQLAMLHAKKYAELAKSLGVNEKLLNHLMEDK